MRIIRTLTCALALSLSLTGCQVIAELGEPAETTSSAATEGEAATVSSVVDGDTIKVAIEGRPHTVRLLNVDTPETVHPQKTDQCMGAEASELTSSLLPAGTKIHLRYDVEPTDRYGRTLALVTVDGASSSVNEQLVAAGLAEPVTFGKNKAFRPLMDAASDRAASEQLGRFDPAAPCVFGDPLE